MTRDVGQVGNLRPIGNRPSDAPEIFLQKSNLYSLLGLKKLRLGHSDNSATVSM
jgi:hypothetical protein